MRDRTACGGGADEQVIPHGSEEKAHVKRGLQQRRIVRPADTSKRVAIIGREMIADSADPVPWRSGVRINARDHISCRRVEAGVSGMHDPRLRLADNLRAEIPRHLRCPVDGSVIHDNHLMRRNVLIHDRLQTRAERGLFVERRYDDGDAHGEGDDLTELSLR